jgi:hypothetical protein
MARRTAAQAAERRALEARARTLGVSVTVWGGVGARFPKDDATLARQVEAGEADAARGRAIDAATAAKAKAASEARARTLGVSVAASEAERAIFGDAFAALDAKAKAASEADARGRAIDAATTGATYQFAPRGNEALLAMARAKRAILTFALLDVKEFEAVRQALDSFVENALDMEDYETPHLTAAQAVLDRMNAAIAILAE